MFALLTVPYSSGVTNDLYLPPQPSTIPLQFT